jgi:hypothetical protein
MKDYAIESRSKDFLNVTNERQVLMDWLDRIEVVVVLGVLYWLVN